MPIPGTSGKIPGIRNIVTGHFPDGKNPRQKNYRESSGKDRTHEGIHVELESPVDKPAGRSRHTPAEIILLRHMEHQRKSDGSDACGDSFFNQTQNHKLPPIPHHIIIRPTPRAMLKITISVSSNRTAPAI